MVNIIDATFTIDSDKHNFILREKKKGKKEILHFFPNLKQLSNFIVGYKLRKFLVKAEVDLLDNPPQTPSYSSVIEQSVLKLEHYIESIISNENEKT